jgi:large subunit ribosomal protein L14e
MTTTDIGRVCVKTLGREAGSKCVVVDIIDKSYVLVTGPRSLTGVKRRRANVRHLQPLGDRIDIAKGADDDEVLKTLDTAGLIDAMRQP